MKHYILIPLFLFVFSLQFFGQFFGQNFGTFSSAPAFAQHSASSSDAKADEVITKDDVSNLIDTLENDQSREKFLGDLKTLVQQQKAQAAEEDAPLAAPLTEAIGVRAGVSQAVDTYEKFLDENNLSASLVSQFVGSSIVLMIALGFLLGVRKMSKKILKMVDKLSQKIGIKLSRLNVYTNVLQFILKVLISAMAVYTLGKIWSIGFVDAFFESVQMRAFIGTSFTVLFVAFVAAVIWEAVGIYLSYMFKQADSQNQTRVKTLLPIVRNVVMMVVFVLFGLVLLSEVGINVTPLLAGAGVIGVAIGFGAQTMVKDFLSGFTIILEDLFRVGDVVTLGGNTGVVEQITLRKVQLRDVAGIVYTVPFSEITTIQNLTKDYSFYVMDIGITYNVDTDKVVEVLHQVDEDLRADDEYGPLILDKLEIMGVDQFADSAVVIKARIKTLPIKQWFVGREFNRRMKHAFDKAGIEIPFPQRTVTVVNTGSPALPQAVIEGAVD